MAIKDIPTGILPQINVDTLPKKGEENTIYNLAVPDEDFCEQYIWLNGAYKEYNSYATINGALFAEYQQSVNETVAEMQTIIEEQAALIQELEEAVFPKTLVSFEMSITSLVMTELDLVDEEGTVIEANAFATDIWEQEPMVFQAELKNGTYYLKNQDNYALGKPNGDIMPLVCDGAETVQLGSVEIVMITPPKGGVK